MSKRDKRGSHTCGVCGRTFKLAMHLGKHAKVHTKRAVGRRTPARARRSRSLPPSTFSSIMDGLVMPAPKRGRGRRAKTVTGMMNISQLRPLTNGAEPANARQIGGAHYKDRPIQCWDYIIANELGFLEGNVVKLVTRWRDKGGVVDLEKARHYIDKLIETGIH